MILLFETTQSITLFGKSNISVFWCHLLETSGLPRYRSWSPSVPHHGSCGKRDPRWRRTDLLGPHYNPRGFANKRHHWSYSSVVTTPNYCTKNSEISRLKSQILSFYHIRLFFGQKTYTIKNWFWQKDICLFYDQLGKNTKQKDFLVWEI